MLLSSMLAHRVASPCVPDTFPRHTATLFSAALRFLGYAFPPIHASLSSRRLRPRSPPVLVALVGFVPLTALA